MSNDSLSNLALLSIESGRADLIDLDNFVDEFDSRHENHIPLFQCCVYFIV